MMLIPEIILEAVVVVLFKTSIIKQIQVQHNCLRAAFQEKEITAKKYSNNKNLIYPVHETPGKSNCSYPIRLQGIGKDVGNGPA
jgi:hypothetical protein